MLNRTLAIVSCLSMVAVTTLCTAVVWAADAAPVRLHGATSITKLLQAKAADIEGKHNVKLEIVGNSSGRGLQSLIAGTADIAMLAGELDLNAAFLNSQKPGSIDVSKLNEFVLYTETIYPLVNASNSVASLTSEQMKDILTGKVKNWKEVGGADLPIVVVLAPPTDGNVITIKAKMLGGGAYTSDARMMQSSPDINKVLPQLPGGFAFMAGTNKSESLKVVKLDKELTGSRALVTIGEPAEPLKSVIKTAQELLKK